MGKRLAACELSVTLACESEGYKKTMLLAASLMEFGGARQEMPVEFLSGILVTSTVSSERHSCTYVKSSPDSARLTVRDAIGI